MIPDLSVAILKFLELYIVVDSVIPDMDNVTEILPPNLRWTAPIEQRLSAEFFQLINDPHWQSVKKDTKRNITFESLYSVDYGRRLLLCTAYIEADVKSLVDSFFLHFWRSDNGYSSAIGDHKLLTYGGRDRYAMWAESSTVAGGAVASRAFDMMLFRQDCIQKSSTTGEYVYNQRFYCEDGTPNLILYTNTSGEIDFELNEEVVQGNHGTSGMLITAISKGPPPLTELKWLYNADYNLPVPIPDRVEARIVSNMLMKYVVELKDHLAETNSAMNVI